MTSLFTTFSEIPQAPSRNSSEPLETPASTHFRCYCTALMARARFMSNGWRNIPCDGSICSSRRREQEQLPTPLQLQMLS